MYDARRRLVGVTAAHRFIGLLFGKWPTANKIANAKRILGIRPLERVYEVIYTDRERFIRDNAQHPTVGPEYAPVGEQLTGLCIVGWGSGTMGCRCLRGCLYHQAS